MSRETPTPEPIGTRIARLIGAPIITSSITSPPLIRKKAPVPEYRDVRPYGAGSLLPTRFSPGKKYAGSPYVRTYEPVSPVVQEVTASPSALVHRQAVVKKVYPRTPLPVVLRSEFVAPVPVSPEMLTLPPSTLQEPEVLELEKKK